MIRKGIILAGGFGTRMSPLTKAVNKQLLPVYDKPLVFYPLSILMLAKIKDVLIVVNKGQLNQYKKILPNGKNLGMKISYIEQTYPRGLPDAFILGEKFIGKNNVALILGDNFFYGQSLTEKLRECTKLKSGAKLFLHPVSDPSLYGVVKINSKNQIVISCKNDTIEKTLELCKEAGARQAIKLPVSGAFHSKLMIPAQNKLNQHIDTISFKKPTSPIICNTNKMVTSNPNILKEELYHQCYWTN